MPEKRSQPRKTCNSRIDILDVESNEFIGTLVNISASGFMMITEKALPENYVFQFQIVFAPGSAGSHSIQLGAESLWVQEMEGSNQRWIGFHVIDISDTDKTTLSSLIGDWRV
jgi:hypothetical protein